MTFDMKAWKRAYRQTHREEIRLYKKAYREKNLEHEREMERLRAGRTDYRRARYVRIRASLWAAKDGPCADCGVRYPPCVMDFDHRDPTTKSFGVGSVTGRTTSKAVLLAEIAKCDLVCANCHRLRTWKRSMSSRLAVAGEGEP